MKSWLVFLIILSGIVLHLDAEEPFTNYFTVARLKYGGGGDWYNDPSAIPNLLEELKKRTQITAASDQVIVELNDERLFNYPFLFITGHGNIKFTSQEAQQLRLYLENGGFLYIDDDYGMDRSVRREIRKVFPDSKLVELPFSHAIYHCHYSFPHGLPKVHEHDGKAPRGYGVFLDKRLVLFYTYETNISDGWADPDVHKDPPKKREQAFKMGTNIIVYSLLN